MPVGFKNLTSGSVKEALDGVISARVSHNFFSVTEAGTVANVKSAGNQDCHVIIRGGAEPNYEEKFVAQISEMMQKVSIGTGMIINCSHGNSKKIWERQILVALYARRLHLTGKYPVRGIMLESNLLSANQKISKEMK
jgi:3-deoxy-7-phosphoheptulonate synthase